jgi:hypothetical protein
MLVVCCVCRRVRRDGAWLDETLPSGALVSHGYCPDCAAAARVELMLLQLKNLREPEIPAAPRSAVA